MAKQAQGSKGKNQPFAEDLKFTKKKEKDILFWNFKDRKTILCTIEGEKDLEYSVYLVKEYNTKDQYYLPKHSGISEFVEENGTNGVYKITLNEVVPFKQGKKTYHSYDIEFAPFE